MNPRPRSEKVVKAFEKELAMVTELSKEADCGRGKN
jgi:hypothetical protein